LLAVAVGTTAGAGRQTVLFVTDQLDQAVLEVWPHRVVGGSQSPGGGSDRGRGWSAAGVALTTLCVAFFGVFFGAKLVRSHRAQRACNSPTGIGARYQKLIPKSWIRDSTF
jgi:hypothetical protein